MGFWYMYKWGMDGCIYCVYKYIILVLIASDSNIRKLFLSGILFNLLWISDFIAWWSENVTSVIFYFFALMSFSSSPRMWSVLVNVPLTPANTSSFCKAQRLAHTLPLFDHVGWRDPHPHTCNPSMLRPWPKNCSIYCFL